MERGAVAVPARSLTRSLSRSLVRVLARIRTGARERPGRMRGGDARQMLVSPRRAPVGPIGFNAALRGMLG